MNIKTEEAEVVSAVTSGSWPAVRPGGATRRCVLPADGCYGAGAQSAAVWTASMQDVFVTSLSSAGVNGRSVRDHQHHFSFQALTCKARLRLHNRSRRMHSHCGSSASDGPACRC